MTTLSCIPCRQLYKSASCELPFVAFVVKKLDNGREIMTDYDNLAVRRRIVRGSSVLSSLFYQLEERKFGERHKSCLFISHSQSCKHTRTYDIVHKNLILLTRPEKFSGALKMEPTQSGRTNCLKYRDVRDTGLYFDRLDMFTTYTLDLSQGRE